MARTQRTIQQLPSNLGATPTFTTIDATLVTNGLEVTDAFEGRGAIVVHAKNTNAAAKNVTVQSGDGNGYPFDDHAGVGDLVEQIGATTGEELILLGDGARFCQLGQSLFIDFEAGMTGSVAVYRVAG
jgi:hypothetical protein